MTISGRTKLIAHLGYPTESFKAPMIYNPYFEKHDIDAVVVPMGCKAEDYPSLSQARVQAFQYPWCACHHAAQGDHGPVAG
jgi:shikimate 5-dehydrogenase